MKYQDAFTRLMANHIGQPYDLKDIEIVQEGLNKIESIEKNGVDYMSKCDGLYLALSQFEKGTKDYERIKKLSNFIDYRMQENREMENTLLYIAQLINENKTSYLNDFVQDHLGKSIDDIVSDMKYETEHNFTEDNQEPYEIKRKSDYL